MRLVSTTLAVLVASAALVGVSRAADRIHIAGSSTVLPYARIVAEHFTKTYPDFKAPVIESGGSGAGFEAFCKGAGPETIDIANASRPIKPSEIRTCAANGVTGIAEIRIGYDGIVFATDKSAQDFAFKPADLFLAMAAEVPVNGRIAANPNTNWNQIDRTFKDQEIQTFIPGKMHGTREVFEEKVILAGCKETGAYDLYVKSGLSVADAAGKCLAIRKDGKAVDIDGDYPETLARLDADRKAVCVFGLFFYENNRDRLKVATVSGIRPSQATIADGTYPISRPLFLYVKKSHLDAVPGMKKFVEFFISDRMAGPGGPLAEQGFVPAPDRERDETRASVVSWKNM